MLFWRLHCLQHNDIPRGAVGAGPLVVSAPDRWGTEENGPRADVESALTLGTKAVAGVVAGAAQRFLAAGAAALEPLHGAALRHGAMARTMGSLGWVIGQLDEEPAAGSVDLQVIQGNQVTLAPRPRRVAMVP